MKNQDFTSCFESRPVILTEGSIELRIVNEFGIKPDKNIRTAALIYGSEIRRALETVYRQYLQIAEDYSLPILIMTSTRRTNSPVLKPEILTNQFLSRLDPG